MKLPRYNIARSTVGELQSVRSGAISPAEAANVQMAKYGAIAATAKSIGDIAVGIDEIKGEQELIDGVVDFDAATAELDRGIDAIQPSDDGTGNLSFDAQEAIKVELGARKSITNAIRGNMKSGSAKRRFDQYIVNKNLRRNGRVQAALYAKEAEFVGAMAMDKLNTMVQNESYDAAIEYNKQLVKNAIIGAEQFKKNEYTIRNTEDLDYFGTIINAEVFNEEDAMVARTELSVGRRNGRNIQLSTQQEGTLLNQINARYAREYASDNDKIKDAQYANYVALDNTDGLTQQQLVQVVQNGINNPKLGIAKADYDKLSKKILDPTGSGSVSGAGTDPVQYRALAAEVSEFGLPVPSVLNLPPMEQGASPAYEWDERYDDLTRRITYADLSTREEQALLGIMEATKKVVLNDPEFKATSKSLWDDVAGFEEGSLTEQMNNMDSSFADARNFANDAKKDLLTWRLKHGGGKQEELDKYAETLNTLYKFKLGQKSLTKLGVTANYPKDGVLDDAFLKNIGTQLTDIMTNGDTSLSKQRRVKGAIKQIERISGVNLMEYMTTTKKKADPNNKGAYSG